MMLVRLVAAAAWLFCGAAQAADAAPVPALSQTLFGWIIVLAVMVGALWLIKRIGMVKGGAASVGKIVGGVSVGSRERVVVVEIGDQWIVVGVAPGRVSPLAQLPRQERADTVVAPASPNFAHWLKQTIDKRTGNTGR